MEPRHHSYPHIPSLGNLEMSSALFQTKNCRCLPRHAVLSSISAQRFDASRLDSGRPSPGPSPRLLTEMPSSKPRSKFCPLHNIGILSSAWNFFSSLGRRHAFAAGASPHPPRPQRGRCPCANVQVFVFSPLLPPPLKMPYKERKKEFPKRRPRVCHPLPPPKSLDLKKRRSQKMRPLKK